MTRDELSSPPTLFSKWKKMASNHFTQCFTTIIDNISKNDIPY